MWKINYEIRAIVYKYRNKAILSINTSLLLAYFFDFKMNNISLILLRDLSTDNY